MRETIVWGGDCDKVVLHTCISTYNMAINITVYYVCHGAAIKCDVKYVLTILDYLIFSAQSKCIMVKLHDGNTTSICALWQIVTCSHHHWKMEAGLAFPTATQFKTVIRHICLNMHYLLIVTNCITKWYQTRNASIDWVLLVKARSNFGWIDGCCQWRVNISFSTLFDQVVMFNNDMDWHGPLIWSKQHLDSLWSHIDIDKKQRCGSTLVDAVY